MEGFEQDEIDFLQALRSYTDNLSNSLAGAESHGHEPKNVVVHLTNALNEIDEIMKRTKSLELLRDKANLDRDIVLS